MKFLKILGVVCGCLLSIASFSQTRKNKIIAPPLPKYYLDSNYNWRYAILKFDFNKHKNYFDKNNKPSTVTDAEVNEIEALIKKRVAIYNKNAIRLIVKPEKYFKQFIAVLNVKGEKVVWINCLCKVFGNSWKKDVSVENDGGNCYFQLKINLRSKKVYDFYTNGLA